MCDGGQTNAANTPRRGGPDPHPAPATHLCSAVFDVERTERARLSGELHDVPAQVLSAAQWQLEAMAMELDEPLRERLLTVATSLADAQRYLRALMGRLDPPALASEGLAIAVRDLLEETFGAGPEITLDADDLTDPPIGASSVMLRLVHAALSRVGRTNAGPRFDVVLADADEGVLFRLVDRADPRHPAAADDSSAVLAAALATAAGGWWRTATVASPDHAIHTESWLPHW